MLHCTHHHFDTHIAEYCCVWRARQALCTRFPSIYLTSLDFITLSRSHHTLVFMLLLSLLHCGKNCFLIFLIQLVWCYNLSKSKNLPQECCCRPHMNKREWQINDWNNKRKMVSPLYRRKLLFTTDVICLVVNIVPKRALIRCAISLQLIHVAHSSVTQTCENENIQMLQALCVLYVLEMFIVMESFGVHKLYGVPTIFTTNKISVWSQYTNITNIPIKSI